MHNHVERGIFKMSKESTSQSWAIFGLLGTIVSIYLFWLLPIYWGILLLIPWAICGAISDDSANGSDGGGIALGIVAIVELYCWWPDIWNYIVGGRLCMTLFGLVW